MDEDQLLLQRQQQLNNNQGPDYGSIREGTEPSEDGQQS